MSAGDAFSLFSENAWRGLAGFRGEASTRVWCYRIAFRAALTQRRDPYLRRRNRLETTMASRLAGKIFATTAIDREREGNALERLRASGFAVRALSPAEALQRAEVMVREGTPEMGREALQALDGYPLKGAELGQLHLLRARLARVEGRFEDVANETNGPRHDAQSSADLPVEAHFATECADRAGRNAAGGRRCPAPPRPAASRGGRDPGSARRDRGP